MKNKLSNSNKESLFNLFYILGMLLLLLVILTLSFNRNEIGLFEKHDDHVIRAFEQKQGFDHLQNQTFPLIDSLFTDLKTLSVKEEDPVRKNRVKYSINRLKLIKSAEEGGDTRANNYSIIAQYSRMYFDDKRIVKKQNENLVEFSYQLENCMIGKKEQRDQLFQMMVSGK